MSKARAKVRLGDAGVEASTLNESDDSDYSEDSEDSDENDDEDSDGDGVTTNVFADARRLFPWQDDFKAETRNIWTAIEGARAEEEQVRAVQEFFSEIIFRRVRGKAFDSALMHYLAILGINEEMNRLREGHDFSCMLAGWVYCPRVLAVEMLLPLGERDQQTDEDGKRFRERRAAYLADGSYSVMSKMISLLAYGKHIALNRGNAGAVMWSKMEER